MDPLNLIFNSMCERCCLPNLLNHYSGFSSEILERTKIPKLYKITTLRSLWMGLIHLMTSVLCFFQISTLLHPSLSETSSHPCFLKEVLDVLSANFCELNTLSLDKSIPEESSIHLKAFHEWTSLKTACTYIVCGVLVQDILLAIRNKMNHVFYSRILGLIFVMSAGRLRCPILSIQGTYLMSINFASKEIACALAAWKSYSQEDCDRRPSPGIKFITFLVFVIHIVIWFSLMSFYLPLFIHKLPSVIKDDANRFYLAYSYLSILAYTVLEAATSPIWTSIRCLAWCRRSSGTMWRILALSDCHLLGHYSPIVQELYQIQMILDEKKALSKNKMAVKHLAFNEAFNERRKQKAESYSQISPFPVLRTAVKTVVALKKKLHRRRKLGLNPSGNVEDQLKVVTPEDSNSKGEGTSTSEDEEIIALMGSNQDCDDICEAVLQDGPEAFGKEEEELNFEKDEEESSFEKDEEESSFEKDEEESSFEKDEEESSFEKDEEESNFEKDEEESNFEKDEEESNFEKDEEESIERTLVKTTEPKKSTAK